MKQAPTLHSLLPAYRRYLESLCHANSTVNTYVQEARSFSRFASQRSSPCPHTVKVTDLDAWQRAMIGSARIKLTTVVTRMRQLHAFFKYLFEGSFIQRSPFTGFPLPHLPRVLPRDVLTSAEVNLLLETPDQRTNAGRRDHLILELLYATGLRVSELCCLDISDINLLPSRARQMRQGRQRSCGASGKTDRDQDRQAHRGQSFAPCLNAGEGPPAFRHMARASNLSKDG